MTELFYASSVIERLEKDNVVYSGGIIHWYVTESRRDQRFYPDLIEGYYNMDPFQRIYSEEFIDELLTASEAVQLAGFLNAIQDDSFKINGKVCGLLQTRKVELPIDGGQLGYRHRSVGGGKSKYIISNQEAYNLAFNVHGYVDISEEGNTVRLQNSMQYVRRILTSLNVDADIMADQIEDIVRTYYKEEGLYVTAATPDNILQHIDLPGTGLT